MADLCKEYGVNAEQAGALNIDENTALRAGAGSGKTRVLTKRFVRLLLERPEVDLKSIVAITFTRRAATEMKDRIRKELSARLSRSNNPETKKRLVQLRMMITTASIDTIHGFCGRLIRNNYIILGIDPAFEIIEEVDAGMKLSQLTDEAIRAYMDNPENRERLEAVIKAYSSGILAGSLKNSVINLYQSIREKGLSPSEISFSQYKTESKAGNESSLLEEIAIELLKVLDWSYTKYKNRENLLDFSDLEVLACKLLQNNEISRRLFNSIRYLLVDEFQDVNPLQKRILDFLCIHEGKIPEGKLFVVGDHKQSIYGFRGADYRVFEETCKKVSETGQVRHLSNCYRSTKNIIDTVNHVFQHLLNPFEPLQYPDADKDRGALIELITWEKSAIKDESSITRWEAVKKLLTDGSKVEEFKKALYADYSGNIAVDKKDLQGDMIAGKIQQLINEGFGYCDIAILLRSRTSLQAIEGSLERNTIPYCVLGGLGFWERQEIIDILALYQLIFQPEDRLAFYSVLRSPLFSFSDDTLLLFSHIQKKNEGNVRISMQLEQLCHNCTDEEKWAVERATRIFKKLLPLDGILNARSLLQLILEQTGYPEILLSLPQGEKKYRNLEKLIRIVDEFENKGIYTARELPGYLQMLQESAGLDGEAFLDNEDSNAVKILTIHASKGLEFPAVIIPDMDRAVDAMSKKDKPLLYFHPQKGICAIGLNEELETDRNVNPDYAEIYTQRLSRELEDSRRVFYVAATRAEKFLAFVGELQDVDADEPLEDQNSFMKQLLWALANGGECECIREVDGGSLIRDKLQIEKYPPEWAKENVDLIEETLKKEEDFTGLIRAYSPEASGVLSISQWLKYRNCPRGYFLEQIAKITAMSSEDSENDAALILEKDEEALSASEMGTLVHKLLEEIENLDVELIEDVLKETAASSEKDITEEDMKRVRCLMQGFLKIEKERSNLIKGQRIAVLKELNFRVPLNQRVFLGGIIDRVDVYQYEGKLSAKIIDYKTNRIRSREEAEQKAGYYEIQLLAYAHALSKLPFFNGQKVEVNEALLYFLDCGEYVAIDLQKDLIDSALHEITASAPHLLGDKTFDEYPCVKSENCSWCDFKIYCDNYFLEETH